MDKLTLHAPLSGRCLQIILLNLQSILATSDRCHHLDEKLSHIKTALPLRHLNTIEWREPTRANYKLDWI